MGEEVIHTSFFVASTQHYAFVSNRIPCSPVWANVAILGGYQ